MNYLALHLDLGSLYHQDILIYLKSQEALEILPAQEYQRILGLLKGRKEIINALQGKCTIAIKMTQTKEWDFQNRKHLQFPLIFVLFFQMIPWKLFFIF